MVSYYENGTSMQDEESTTSNIERQLQQTVRRVTYKVKLWKKKLETPKIRTLIFIIGLLLILKALEIIVKASLIILPSLAVHDAMVRYDNNLTLASLHVTTATNLLSFFATLAYVVLTWIIVTQSEKAVKKSEEAIAQSKKEQRIRDIENRLEKFYIPAIDIINGPLRKEKHGIIRGKPSENLDGLVSISKYNYLAEKNTYKAFEKFMTKDCRDFKLNTCDNLYRDIYGYECPHVDEGCRSNWFYCEENFEYCKYYDECPNENASGVVTNNTYCKYYVDLKGKLTEDIEKYKKRLLELKE